MPAPRPVRKIEKEYSILSDIESPPCMLGLDYGPAPGDQPEHQNNYCQNQQDMQEPTHGV
jgi:hypothetical protein